MTDKISKKDALKKIEEFFNRDNFSSEEVVKIKKIAMSFNIKLGDKKKKFCKKCLSKLNGKTRIGKDWKTVECQKCGHKNKFSLRKD